MSRRTPPSSEFAFPLGLSCLGLTAIPRFLSYKQQRFNLMREENEGYSKLITELSGWTSSKSPIESIDAILQNIQSLIGYFELDPIKVLDVVLTFFETHISQHAQYVALIRLYNPTSLMLANVLGFRFRQFTVSPSLPFSLGKHYLHLSFPSLLKET